MSKKTEEDHQATVEYMMYAHGRIDALKESIYLRASIMVAADAFIATQGATTLIQCWSEVQITASYYIIAAVGVLFVSLMLATTFWTISCLHPLRSADAIYDILKASDKGGDHLDRVPVFTAFPHITCQQRPDFESAVAGLTREEVVSQLANATYTLSHITERRYDMLGRGSFYLMATIACYGLLTLIRLWI